MLSKKLKEITAILLIATLVFSLSACTGATGGQEKSDDKQTTATTEEQANDKAAKGDQNDKVDTDEKNDKADEQDKADGNKVIKDGEEVTLTAQEKKNFTIDGYQLGEIPPIPKIEVEEELPKIEQPPETKFEDKYSAEQNKVIEAIKTGFEKTEGISIQPAVFSGGEMVYVPFLDDANNQHFESTDGNTKSVKIDKYTGGSQYYKNVDGDKTTKIEKTASGNKHYQDIDGNTKSVIIDMYTDGSQYYKNVDGNKTTKIEKTASGNKHYQDIDGNTKSTIIDKYADGSQYYKKVDGNKTTKLEKTAGGNKHYQVIDGNTKSTIIDIYADGSQFYKNIDGNKTIKLEKTASGNKHYQDIDGNTKSTIIDKYADGSQFYKNIDANKTIKLENTAEGNEHYQVIDGNTKSTIIDKYTDGSQFYKNIDANETIKIEIHSKEKAYYQSIDGDSIIRCKYWDKNNADYEDDKLKIEIADGVATIKNKESGEEIEVKALPFAEIPMIGELPKIEDIPDIDDTPDIGDIGDFEVKGFRVIFDDAILFDFDKHELRPEGKVIIELLVDQINNLNIAEIEVHGHTDAISDEAYNQALSEKRAASVDAFAREVGLNASTKSIGYGETKPVAPNSNPDGSDNPAGRQANRRVEVFIPVK